MKRVLLMSVVAIASAGLLSAIIAAGVPVQDMSSTSIGIDYSGVWRGEEITKRNVPAHESVHHVNVRYAPLPYIMFSAGLGAANFSVDTCQQVQFKGGHNFSPALGITLFSPAFLKKTLRVIAGAKAHYLYTRDNDKLFTYSGPVAITNGGFIVSLGQYIDIEAGARSMLIVGSMQEGDRKAQAFSNSDQLRGYFSVTLHSPSDGAYMSFDFDASRQMDMNWTNGPAESSIGVSIGIILRQPKDRLSRKMSNHEDYPGYKELEKKIEEMEKEMK
jgi:hypothetical protein